jgi:hypothetical protein
MADPELEALRQKRLNELQQAQGGPGGGAYGGGYGVRTRFNKRVSYFDLVIFSFRMTQVKKKK